MPAKQLITEEETKESFKETMINELAVLLSDALPALKLSLGEKKFGKRIRKAAKLLTEGIKPGTSKKDDTAEIDASLKKAVPKKVKVVPPAKNAKKSIGKK